ncbi:PKD domain-containing protein [bacterium]|nr:PKD domain-containing protein [bacterium]
MLLGIASLSCGGKQQCLEPATETALQTGQPLEGIPGWPSALPIDKVQPWEQLDGNGQVIPAQRTASAINQQSEFIPGVERFSSSGDVTDNGEASRIASTAGTTAQATFRIPLAGGHPGVVSVDANLLAGKGYYLGLADYGSSRWQWHGPFTDNHVRISTALQGPYTSSLGNLFISVLVHGGSAADIVGIGMNPEDPADSSAPPQPSGLSATALSGTLLLDWDSVIAGDLAGYRIYHSSAEFISGDEAGVLRLDSLEGFNQHLLAMPSGNAAYVRVSAVDISGNESPLSDIASAIPLAGTPPQLAINVDKPSGILSESVSLTAIGAEQYDFDLDGDGIYDITGNSSGIAQVDTTSLGIIRPRVRGTGPEGTAVALGAVSLVVTGNSRPVAVASSDLSSGAAPLDVSFSGSESTDFDGTVVGGGWDFDGDGTYDVWDDTDIVHVTSAMHTYSAAGVYNAKLRVLDDQGAWDVDTVTIVVSQEPDPDNIDPSAHLYVDPTYGDTGVLVTLDASSSADLDGSIVLYEYDFNGDGLYDGSGAVSSISRKYDEMGVFNVGVRVTDDNGAQDTATASLRINEVPSLHTSWPGLRP